MRRTLEVLRVIALSVLVGLLPSMAIAQEPQPAAPPPEAADPDVRVDPLQPDFNLAALPTTLRLPARKWAFRVTHRFTRPLGEGNFGDLLRDAFGFDAGAQIGLELRYGLLSGTQLVVHRTSDRTIQITAQHNIFSERRERRFGLDAVVGFDGDNNLRDNHRAIIGAVASKNIGRWAAVYAEPFWLSNTNAIDVPGTDNNTMLIGLGTRIRVRPSVYLLGEITPRVAGYDPGVNQASIALEGRAGGHLFQINFSNGFGTTLSQLASRGGVSNDNWYIGFNIARKFF